jgi:hypothetical protein
MHPAWRKAGVAAASVPALAAAVAVLSCSGDSAGPDTRTLRGAEIVVGAGRARTEVVLDRGDQVESLAVVFERGSLTGLPETLPNTEFIVPLPADAPPTVFNHIGINWQPQGHPPMAVYTQPHFDVHYYLVSMQERDAMTPANPQFGAGAARAPAAGEIPPGYVGDLFAIPRMGTHWTDGNSHEFHGQAFTTTVVYGFYDGEMVFLEPMMTKAFLDALPDQTRELSVPAKYPRSGRYPTSWRVHYDARAGEYRVELGGFVSRQ